MNSPVSYARFSESLREDTPDIINVTARVPLGDMEPLPGVLLSDVQVDVIGESYDASFGRCFSILVVLVGDRAVTGGGLAKAVSDWIESQVIEQHFPKIIDALETAAREG